MVEDLIRRARRRFVYNEALKQLAFAGALMAAGSAVLLIVGTRYLEWWALTIISGAGLVAGAVRTYGAIPDSYATAVRLDRNGGLRDVLSTALYFSVHPGQYPEFLNAQREQAEAAAASISLNDAAPFTFPRALYAVAALGLLASGLVILRYGVTRRLDLRAPITEVLFEDQAAKPAGPKQSAEDAARRKRLENAESLLAKLGVPVNPEEQKQQEALDKAIDQALEGPTSAAEKGQKGEPGKSENGQSGSGLEQSPNGDPLDGKPGEGAKDDQSGKSGDQKATPNDKGGSKNGTAGDNSSLMSKLKDAVSNMFSKAGQDKNQAAQKGQQPQGQSAKADKAAGEKGTAGKGQEQGQSQADAQDSEPNGDAQEGQQAQGKSNSKNAQQSAQAGSGVGSQDGAKDLKAANDLKAMGKISEIIGKRAATVSGETTIEVQSGNQQLRTAYTNKTAAHGEADSDVTRDEIPVELQPYVQQYFEQVRKAAPKAAPVKK